MIDLIDKANKITEFQKNLNISSTEAKQKVEEAEKNISYGQNLLSETKVLEDEIKKLPTMKNPELVKKQQESDVLTTKTEADRKLQELKETGITDLKTKLKDAAVFLPKVPSLPKLPVVDARVLAALGFIKKVKEIRDKKQQESVENIKKSKEAYTFPMKKSTTSETPTAPTVPDIPIKPPLSPNITPTSEITSPVKSKFTYTLDGGGGLPFELVAMRYDGRLLDITSWPINTKFSPNYGFNNFPDGLQSVRANIQFYINRGTFDSYVTKPY